MGIDGEEDYYGEEDMKFESSESDSSTEDDMNRYFEEKGHFSGMPANNEQRSVLDERLAKVLESYDDSDIGALEDEEIRGGSLQPNDDLFKQAEEDFEKKRKVNKKPSMPVKELPAKPVALIVQDGNSDDGEEITSSDEDTLERDELEKIKIRLRAKETQMHNCESILSVASSCIPNHMPRIIVEKSDKPRNISVSSNAQQNALKTVEESDSDEPDTTSSNKPPLIRKRDETAEERKARKAELREKKKERRGQKKALKDVFGREKCVIERQLASTISAVRLV